MTNFESLSNPGSESVIIQTIITVRKRLGLTQEELAEKAGLTQAYISRLEAGVANPSLRTLQRLADGMGLVLKLEFAQPTSGK